jgi:hypothetical protein
MWSWLVLSSALAQTADAFDSLWHDRVVPGTGEVLFTEAERQAVEARRVCESTSVEW